MLPVTVWGGLACSAAHDAPRAACSETFQHACYVVPGGEAIIRGLFVRNAFNSRTLRHFIRVSKNIRRFPVGVEKAESLGRTGHLACTDCTSSRELIDQPPVGLLDGLGCRRLSEVLTWRALSSCMHSPTEMHLEQLVMSLAANLPFTSFYLNNNTRSLSSKISVKSANENNVV